MRGAMAVPRAIMRHFPSAARAGASPRILAALRARSRLLAALLLALVGLGVWRSGFAPTRAATRSEALARHLRQRGLELDLAGEQPLVWLADEPNLFGVRPALFVARTRGELRDVYYADVRVSGDAVLDTRLLTNLTRTSSADEDRLLASGPFVSYPARVGATYDALVVLDTRGEPKSQTARWPWYAQLQNAITNLQDTGRVRAFGVRRYTFVDAPSALQVHVEHGHISLRAGAQSIVLDPRRDAPLVGAAAVALERAEKGQPGLITWLIDTVRRVPFIGRAPIEWLEHKVFGLTDRASRAYHEVVATDTAAEVELALVAASPTMSSAAALPPSAAASAAIPGWPPDALSPVLADPVRGEGAWLAVGDEFAPQAPGGGLLFLQTFLRVDPERTFTRVYVTLWDARQVQLGIAMGTKEPQSATGETGSGQIPRDPFVLSHLVAAFNGGFQALHGEFGMMAERRVYLPPKPYAATVAVFEDGRVGMGSWPGPGRREWDEELANSQIPRDMIAMRQNLTSVVEGTTYNPWQRWWWGAAPEWADEQTYIPRSGLCLTREGFMAFFWGESMGPDELGKAMLATRCVRGIHLDMNAKHTGFEFYRGFAAGSSPPALGRALAATEFEGTDSGLGGRLFRARLAVTTMAPIRFPRYLGRDPRDFFYLTRKPVLPGADVTLADRRIAFRTTGTPEVGFPPAFARADVQGGPEITRIDVTRAVPAPVAPSAAVRTLAALIPAGAPNSESAPLVALHASYLRGRLRLAVGPAPARAKVLVRGPLLTAATYARAALGVDAEGFLVFARARDSAALRGALQACGIEDALAFDDAQLHFPEPALASPDAGVPLHAPEVAASPKAASDAPALLFLLDARPAADVMFDHVKPVEYARWGYLQDQRVRYFPGEHTARFPTPDAQR